MARTQKKITPQQGEEWSPSLLKSRLYGALLVDIIIGDLAPGQRLDEKALAARYGGGAPDNGHKGGGHAGGGLAGVREALARLALEGLVVRRARVGTMVAPLDPGESREAFLARALIEIECAGLAARHATPAEVKAIRATFDGGEAAVKKNDRRALAAMDEAFHVAIAAASHNRVLAKLVTTLHHTTARFWLVTAGPLAESYEALAQHRALADAIAAGDAPRAQAAMRVALGELS